MILVTCIFLVCVRTYTRASAHTQTHTHTHTNTEPNTQNHTYTRACSGKIERCCYNRCCRFRSDHLPVVKISQSLTLIYIYIYIYIYSYIYICLKISQSLTLLAMLSSDNLHATTLNFEFWFLQRARMRFSRGLFLLHPLRL